MSQSIYEEIGGLDRVLADERLAEYFEGFDMGDLRAHQVQFISSVAGGPVEYSGGDMREAHDDLDIDEPDFDAVGAHLAAALRDNGVGEDNVEAVMSEVVALKAPVLDR